MKQAIAFLCKTPHKSTLDFAEKISQNNNFDVYVISDEMDSIETPKGVKLIQISDSLSVLSGYHSSNIGNNVTHIKKNPIAYDKFLYWFCECAIEYDFVWVFEDDVFIPDVKTIPLLHKKYSMFDLITPNNFKRKGDTLDWHWKHIVTEIEPPYYYSMVCACGMSRNMLNCIRKYVKQHNKLFYIETMFNTLAMQSSLVVFDPLELKSIVWMGDWDLDSFLLLPNSVFHPIKDIGYHDNLREMIRLAKHNGYKPKNRLPEFIKVAM